MKQEYLYLNYDIILKEWLFSHGPEIIWQVRSRTLPIFLEKEEDTPYQQEEISKMIFQLLDAGLSFSSKIIPYLLHKYNDDLIKLIMEYISDYYDSYREKGNLSVLEEKKIACRVLEKFHKQRIGKNKEIFK